MNRRPKIIAGNWKMHGSRHMTETLLTELRQGVGTDERNQMLVFPPYIFLPETQKFLANSPIQWGAQNVAAEKEGAYTGEISALMLREFGCRYVILGHSERRQLFGEIDAVIAQKFAHALQADLCPILCVGETLEQRQQGLTKKVVSEQLLNVMQKAGGVAAFGNAIIAYEPVWAIGTGVTATPEEAQEVHATLRQLIAAEDIKVAETISILYGGSVKASNAKALFAMPDIDGGLIGGASLNAQEFLQIFHSVN